MNSESLIDETIALHKRFWNRELREPIINTQFSLANRLNRLMDYGKSVLHEDWMDKDGLLLEPEMLVPDRHQRFLEYDTPTPPVCGPVFDTIFPWTLVPWLTGIVGCKVRVATVGQTIWPEETLGPDWFHEENMGLKPNKKWLAKLLEFTSYLVKKYHPRCAVTLEMFSRGPGDLLLNLMGTEKAYLAMYDHPDELKGLLSGLTDIHIEWAKAQLALIPRIKGGYCSHWGIWAPGTFTRIQEDFSITMSKKAFFEFLMPCAKRIVDATDYQVFNTHSGAPQLGQWLTELEGLKAVEVTLDPYGPSVTESIPFWNRILEKKPLIISAKLTEEQLKLLVSNLQPNGLVLDIDLTH